VAGLLAQLGYDVLLIERQRFPRYHVGESLTPAVEPQFEFWD
jgi:flavin-dependent dehydrogenase